MQQFVRPTCGNAKDVSVRAVWSLYADSSTRDAPRGAFSSERLSMFRAARLTPLTADLLVSLLRTDVLAKDVERALPQLCVVATTVKHVWRDAVLGAVAAAELLAAGDRPHRVRAIQRARMWPTYVGRLAIDVCTEGLSPVRSSSSKSVLDTLANRLVDVATVFDVNGAPDAKMVVDVALASIARLRLPAAHVCDVLARVVHYVRAGRCAGLDVVKLLLEALQRDALSNSSGPLFVQECVRSPNLIFSPDTVAGGDAFVAHIALSHESLRLAVDLSVALGEGKATRLSLPPCVPAVPKGSTAPLRADWLHALVQSGIAFCVVKDEWTAIATAAGTPITAAVVPLAALYIREKIPIGAPLAVRTIMCRGGVSLPQLSAGAVAVETVARLCDSPSVRIHALALVRERQLTPDAHELFVRAIFASLSFVEYTSLASSIGVRGLQGGDASK
eukprot:Opistho-2@49107